jgi:hypothetical protein
VTQHPKGLLEGYHSPGVERIDNDELLTSDDSNASYKEISEYLTKTKAELLIPLLIAGSWVGLLTIGKIKNGGTYDNQEDYYLLTAVAAHAASAINNAKLVEKEMENREMEAFNHVSSFMIHDLKNATSMLSMVTKNARKHLGDPDFQQESLETISHATEKMNKMILDLSSYRTGLNSHRENLDLNSLISQVVGGFEFTRVTIEKRLGDICPVWADADNMQKVIHNLLLNATDAVGGEGDIIITTGLNDGHVVVTVSDSGPGMSREFMEKFLFKPFKSTKKTGLGIGLYHCKCIVEAHDGKIDVWSEPGKGSTFSVYLPSPFEQTPMDRQP